MKRFIVMILVLLALIATLPALAHRGAQVERVTPAPTPQPKQVDSLPNSAWLEPGWVEANWLLENNPSTQDLPIRVPNQPEGIASTTEFPGDWSNGGALGCILPLGAAHNVALGAGLVSVPPTDFGPAMAEYAANLGLKFCAPAVYPLPDKDELPAAGACSFTFEQNRTQGEYKNFYGLALPWGDVFPGKDWGYLDPPTVIHWNTDVAVTMRNYSMTETDNPDEYELPVGMHAMVWRGQTQISPLDFVPKYIPGALWEKLARLGKLRFVLEQGVERAIDFGFTFVDLPQIDSPMYNEEIQRVAILDQIEPSLWGTEIIGVEAIEPGGLSRRTVLGILRRGLVVTDNCDVTPTIIAENELSLPEFAPVGSTFSVAWVAEDNGPFDLSGMRNRSAVFTQTFTVQDTLAPIILTPPDVVTETIILPAIINLGHPATFDLADLTPTVTHDACSLPGVNCTNEETHFPTGIHTVTWTAIDSAGNQASAQQIVNIKAPGSNHTPTVEGQSGDDQVAAISFEPITVTLQAEDSDTDPLWFRIEEHPEHGFFRAPLYPYFIQDYRLANVQDISFSEYCADPDNRQEYIPTNWPVNANFMAVGDDGTVYVHDQGMIYCQGSGDVDTNYRLAIFRPDGSWEQSISSFNARDVYVDWHRARLYETESTTGGVAWIREYDLDLNQVAEYRLDDAVPTALAMDDARQGIIDEQGIIYVTNGFQYAGASQLRLYTAEYDTSQAIYPQFLADYSIPGAVFQDVALDSEGNLFASERNDDRVYKWSPATLAADGSFIPGELIGWLGRCDSGPGCDQANGRSFGYSCNDVTCSVSATGGNGPGQFDFPRGIALDNNDILYVTDYYNQRVQRFTADGYFAGQAISECDGSCFVLGDFGEPKQITVNASHFYVLDDNTDLLHVFETTPLTRLDEQTAAIVYQSENNFVGGDSFSFSASDGLARSNIATVAIAVERNYRPPTAIGPLTVTTNEDNSVTIPVDGYDPDEALDTLIYQAATPPEYGTFTQQGEQYIYTPDPDFAGTDVFTYEANDGVFVSPPQTITVTVTPANDVPRFPEEDEALPTGFAYRPAGAFSSFARLAPLGTVDEPLSVGRGYELVLTVNFDDPDAGDVNMVQIDWGDGTVEDEVPMPDDGSLPGPVMGEGELGGQGTITGGHVYSQNGEFTINVCISDNAIIDEDGNKSLTTQSTTACQDVPVVVSPTVDMLLAIQPTSKPMPLDNTLSYTLTLTNNPPQTGSGLTATQVTLQDVLDERLQFQSVQTDDGTCSHHANQIDCMLQDLAPGESATVIIDATIPQALSPGTVLLNEGFYSVDKVDQASTQANIEMTTLVAPADFVVTTITDGSDTSAGDGHCNDDNGYCSLRAAVEEANALPGHQVIALADWQFNLASPLAVNDNLTIIGVDAMASVIAGMGQNRLITVPGSASLSLIDLALQAGYVAGDGGALYNAAGTSTLTGVQISGSHADSDGGAIWNGGDLTMTNSSLTGNSASSGVGGIANYGTLMLQNVTIASNTGQHGGLAGSGVATLTNVTMVRNHAEGNGGGIAGGTLTLRNTILANNTADDGPNCMGSVTSQGHNLLGDLDDCVVNQQQASDVIASDPRLALLDLNGAGTLSHAPLGGSPAIDSGACDLTIDQRGISRPVDGNLDTIPACDIGAVEFEPVHLMLPLITR